MSKEKIPTADLVKLERILVANLVKVGYEFGAAKHIAGRIRVIMGMDHVRYYSSNQDVSDLIANPFAEVVSFMGEAFDWGETPEGMRYWDKIRVKLAGE